MKNVIILTVSSLLSLIFCTKHQTDMSYQDCLYSISKRIVEMSEKETSVIDNNYNVCMINENMGPELGQHENDCANAKNQSLRSLEAFTEREIIRLCGSGE